jgi:hypothetical protein
VAFSQSSQKKYHGCTFLSSFASIAHCRCCGAYEGFAVFALGQRHGVNAKTTWLILWCRIDDRPLFGSPFALCGTPRVSMEEAGNIQKPSELLLQVPDMSPDMG